MHTISLSHGKLLCLRGPLCISEIFDLFLKSNILSINQKDNYLDFIFMGTNSFAGNSKLLCIQTPETCMLYVSKKC
jgi:hypothetical protein